jgi:SAM-dependent methyltransferase
LQGGSEPLAVLEDALNRSVQMLNEALGMNIHTEPQRHLREMELATRYVPAGGKILDVGCKLGEKLIALQLLGRKSFGIDNKYVFQSSKIDILKKAWETTGVQIEECDVCRSPLIYPSEMFDCVMCCAVLEHLHSSPKFPLGEMKRVLKPNGVMIITVPNLGAINKRINFLLGRKHYLPLSGYFYGSGPIYGHIREFYRHEIVKIIEWVGELKINHLQLFNHDHVFPRNPLRSLYSRFLTSLSMIYPNFKDAIIVVARKEEKSTPAV